MCAIGGEPGKEARGCVCVTLSPILQKGVVVQRLVGDLSPDRVPVRLWCSCNSPGTVHTLPGRLCCDWPLPLTEAAEADRH